jgi:tetratricopeptide (TPR) repeat protein
MSATEKETPAARPFVFISYSHQDEAEKDQLLAHLGVLQSEGLIELWSDDQLGAGADWQAEIKKTIARAKVAILFVSANFLTSDFILGQEVPAMLQRGEKEGLIILPVIAQPCAWQRVKWLDRLVPKGTQPIWREADTDPDEALAAIAEQVARIVNNEPLAEPVPKFGGSLARREFRIGSLVIPLTSWPLLTIGLLALLGLLFFFYTLLAPLLSSTPTPIPVQPGFFKVALAEFGEKDATGALQPSPVGRQISQRIYESLQLEFESLPAEVRQDFQPVIWHDRLNSPPGGRKLGFIVDEKAAATLASDMGVDLLIYGNLNEGEAGASFVPEFYVAPLRGQAEEILGQQRLGEPIFLRALSAQDAQAALSVNKKLNNRGAALTRFTLGLMYDLGGFHQDALAVFTTALAELDLDEQSGQELFYYFKGRSALFLKQDEEAQKAFEQALALTQNRYTRAYLGLGSVYFRRAQCRLFSTANQAGPQYDELCQRPAGDYIAPCQLSPDECQALIDQDLEQSLDNYQRVIAESLEPSIKITARLSLGMAHRLQGEIAHTQGASDEADALFDSAIEEIRATLTPLEAAGQYRYLAQAYQSLGAAYAQQGQIRERRGDKEGSIILYQQARAALSECLAQQEQSPYDETLAGQIVPGCKHADEVVSTILDGLQGEQQ